MNTCKSDFELYEMFLRATCFDPVISQKVISILKLDPYPRHIVLSNWLEQLRLNNAPQRLIKTLTYLFDDNLAKNVLAYINKQVKST